MSFNCPDIISIYFFIVFILFIHTFFLIIIKYKTIMATLKELSELVRQEREVVQGAAALIKGLAEKVKELKPDQASIDALYQQIQEQSQLLSSAVADNTIASGENRYIDPGIETVDKKEPEDSAGS